MIDLDPEGSARTAIQQRSFEDRTADVCVTCGLHIIKSVPLRLKWLIEGGSVTCEYCNTTKVRTI
jgi:hypothetical protein